VGEVCSEIDTQCEGHIMESDNISQFLAASELWDWANKLNRLEMVKLALLEEDTKVLQNGRDHWAMPGQS
jgi:hypothetical protein